MEQKFKYQVIYSEQAMCEELTKEDLIHVLATMLVGFTDKERETLKSFTITIKGEIDGSTN